MSDGNDLNTKIIEEFRDNAGVVSGPFEGATLMLLTTTGAKTGNKRTTPLVYLPDGNRIVIFASKAGAPTNPDWYHNLTANPAVTVEVGADAYQANAIEITGAERDALFAAQVERMPGFQTYADGTTRVIPVIGLERIA